MMAIRRYTRDDLYHLRDSPLVQKPEDLPAIEQWIDEPQQPQQNTAGSRRQPQAKIGGDASPMGSFSAGVRPGLTTRTTGGGRSGEEMSLGPPRTTFPSSRNTVRLSDFADRTTASTGDVAQEDEQEVPRSRFSGERTNRKSVNDKDSWTLAREKRALGGDDESRHDSRHTRTHRDHDGERKSGYGDKHEGRWNERRQNGDRPGGWRERQREKERDGERGMATEREPEWMDDPAPSNAEDDLRNMGMPRNQEQFQRWKDAMSGKKTQSDEPEGASINQEAPPREPAITRSVAPLKLEGIVDKPFGGWGDGKPPGGTPDPLLTPGKAPAAKSRASRFASMFKESQPREEVPPTEPTAPTTASGGQNGTAEDEAGFKRILQMLGGTNISQAPVPAPEVPTSPPAKSLSNGTKQKSRYTGIFDQAPKSPEASQSPQERVVSPPKNGEMIQIGRSIMDEPNRTFGGVLQDTRPGERASRNQAPMNMMSPEPPANGSREQQGPSGRVNDIFLEQQPPSRGAATPDASIQNLLASQRAQKSAQGQDKNSQFLLNLLQEKGTRPVSQQQRTEFPLWLDQPPNMPTQSTQPHAPKPRGAPPPPGFIDDQLLRNAPPDPPRQEQQQMPDRRMAQQRAPPNFFDDYNLSLQQQQQQQRRNFVEPSQQQLQQAQQQPGPARRPSGHPGNLPPMQMPPHHQFAGGPPPEFLQQGPPPGFNPQMQRHPPGFHNFPTNIYQQPPPPQQQKIDHLAGGNFPGGMPSGAGGMAPLGYLGGPQGMPPPPPGFMGMRGPNDGGIAAGGMGIRDAAGRGYDGARFEQYDGPIQRR